MFVFGRQKTTKDQWIYGLVKALNDSPSRPPAIEMAHQFNCFTTPARPALSRVWHQELPAPCKYAKKKTTQTRPAVWFLRLHSWGMVMSWRWCILLSKCCSLWFVFGECVVWLWVFVSQIMCYTKTLYRDLQYFQHITLHHRDAPNFGKTTSSQPLVQLAKLCNSYFLKGGGGAGERTWDLLAFIYFFCSLRQDNSCFPQHATLLKAG